MNSYHLSLSCDADDVAGAIRTFIGRLSEDTAASLVEYLGSYHPDGELRRCALLPTGYTLLEVTSTYYGSHEEYGEGDENYFFAIPAGAEAPEVRASHGHFGGSSEGLDKLPEGTLEWDGTGWTPFSYAPAEERRVPAVIPGDVLSEQFERARQELARYKQERG